MNDLLNFRKKYLYQINFYINTKCNLICDYCYARKSLKWDKEIPFDKVLNALEKINSFLPNSFISFIGGEPTIYPNFKELLIESLKFKDLKFHFYTNGKKDLKKILNFKNSEKIKITLSLHKSLFYDNPKDLNKFKENINFLNSKNFDYHLTFVYFDDEKFTTFFDELYKIIPKERIYLSFIHDFFSKKEFFLYKEKYLQFAQKYKVNRYDLKDAKIKKCYYNEINLHYEKNLLYFISNSCLKKFIKYNSLKMINNKVLFNNHNLLILNKKRSNLICTDSCPSDPAFYNSWEKIK